MATDIIPGTGADASLLTPGGLEAFAEDPLNRALENFGQLDPTQQSDHLQCRTQRNLLRMTGPGKHWCKAVDSATGKLVEYVGMLAPKKRGLSLLASTGSVVAPGNVGLELLALFEHKLGGAGKLPHGRQGRFWCKTAPRG